MLRAKVVGSATATTKHESIKGSKMLIVQPLDAQNAPDGFPLLVVDSVGAGGGDSVLLTSDGKFARTFLNTNVTPVRWTIIGIEDE